MVKSTASPSSQLQIYFYFGSLSLTCSTPRPFRVRFTQWPRGNHTEHIKVSSHPAFKCPWESWLSCDMDGMHFESAHSGSFSPSLVLPFPVSRFQALFAWKQNPLCLKGLKKLFVFKSESLIMVHLRIKYVRFALWYFHVAAVLSHDYHFWARVGVVRLRCWLFTEHKSSFFHWEQLKGSFLPSTNLVLTIKYTGRCAPGAGWGTRYLPAQSMLAITLLLSGSSL